MRGGAWTHTAPGLDDEGGAVESHVCCSALSKGMLLLLLLLLLLSCLRSREPEFPQLLHNRAGPTGGLSIQTWATMASFSAAFSKAYPGRPHPVFSPHPGALATQKFWPHPACSRKVNRATGEGPHCCASVLALKAECFGLQMPQFNKQQKSELRPS